MNPIPKTLHANAPVTVWLHIETNGTAERSIRARHRTRAGRMQVHIHGSWRNVPKRGYFKYLDGAIGRVEVVSIEPAALTTDQLREKLRNRYRQSPWHRRLRSIPVQESC